MLDLNLFREDRGGCVDLLKENQSRRFQRSELIDEVVEADATWRQKRFECDHKLKEMNTLTKLIGVKVKAKDSNGLEELKEKVKKMKVEIEEVTKQADELHQRLNDKMELVGNVLHDTVPVSQVENDNEVIREWGVDGHMEVDDDDFMDEGDRLVDDTQPATEEKRYEYHQLLYLLDGCTRSSGDRSYCLKGAVALLHQALITYSMKLLSKHKHLAIQPPSIASNALAKCVRPTARLDEENFKLHGPTDRYLISSSEQALLCLHQNERLSPNKLPLKYASVSRCFEKKLKTRGEYYLLNSQESESVDTYYLTDPESSFDELEMAILLAEHFYKTLKIPHKVVNLCSGLLNNATAKAYAIEAWFPVTKRFQNITTCANTTDYNTRAVDIRFGFPKQGDREKKYVHAIHSRLCPTYRMLCALLENWQNSTGIVIPKVLQPYLDLHFIPFTNPPKKEWSSK
eukprot:TRINITY_DN8716_c0_g1_i1.p1 TRINITY_DN8716_c0_g1~~TRINITY_DN8716_c0_g1_i1.p1  ORF type:complete len:458 (-),score=123.15 TRINITY_DN8716_c0_g1_i1:83-1456(-)